MSSRQELWDYATRIFSLPFIPIQMACEVIGTANIDAISEATNDRILNTNRLLGKIKVEVRKLRSAGHSSELEIEQVQAVGAQSKLIRKNMRELVGLLKVMSATSLTQKFVLPQFRGVSHFKIGDEIMIYIDDTNNSRCIAEYDWISAKVLYSGWDWILYCHSNIPWNNGGDNGGCFLRRDKYGQNFVFKRNDFFGLRNLLHENKDFAFLNLLPSYVAKNICNGTVEPMTDDELKQRQESFIKRAAEVVKSFKDSVPLIAKRYGIEV